jgi:hypothetical protein
LRRRYITKAGTGEGGAGAGSSLSLKERIDALLRGRKQAADRIQVGAGRTGRALGRRRAPALAHAATVAQGRGPTLPLAIQPASQPATFPRGHPPLSHHLAPQVAPGVDDALLQRAADQMKGFSGREIAKFMASVQAAVYGGQESVLTRETFEGGSLAVGGLGHRGPCPAQR